MCQKLLLDCKTLAVILIVILVNVTLSLMVSLDGKGNIEKIVAPTQGLDDVVVLLDYSLTFNKLLLRARRPVNRLEQTQTYFDKP